MAENVKGIKYFQVAYTLRDKKTLERELLVLESIPEVDYNCITNMNVLGWLLEK